MAKPRTRGSQKKSEPTDVKKTIKGPDYPAERGCPDPDCQTAMGPPHTGKPKRSSRQK